MTQSRVLYFRGTSCIHPQSKTAAIIKCHSEEWNLELLLTNARNQTNLEIHVFQDVVMLTGK